MTLYFSHPSSMGHDTGPAHPEHPARLDAVREATDRLELGNLVYCDPVAAQPDTLRLAHSRDYLDYLAETSRKAGESPQYLDPDTVMGKGSLEAALYSAGAAITATGHVAKGLGKNAFCATRPPGHHAEKNKAMGFCILNNVAIAAHHAVTHLGLERVAVIDFDVHHGNGTQDIFWHHPNLFYGSTHEDGHYPFTGGKDQATPDHICNAPLSPGSGGTLFKEAMTGKVLPALIGFNPDMLLVSAGFDAHRDDPLASLQFVGDDFYWITLKLAEIADKYCGGRMVSVLEGGYNLDALGQSAALHIKALSEAAS